MTPTPQDPVAAFENAAETIHTLRPELIDALGYVATESSREAAERVHLASERIVSVLTDIRESTWISEDQLELWAGDPAKLGEQERAPEDSVYEYERVEDEELIGITARWMARRPYFTGRELREHLLLNDVVRPEDVKGNKINALLIELMPYVEEYFYDRGDEVVFFDDRTDPRAVEAVTGKVAGKGPVTYALGFKPRQDVVIPAQPVVEEVVSKPAQAPVDTPVVAEPVETLAHHERSITKEQVLEVKALVAAAGGEMMVKSLMEILTDPEEMGLSEEEAMERIDAAMADGSVYRKGIRGSKGMSLEPATKARPKAEAVPVDDPHYIEQEVEKYARVVDFVMSALTAVEVTQGLAYHRLWRRANLGDLMSFEDFKDYVRRMADDKFVVVPTDAKLSSGKSRSKIIRGSKVMFPSGDVRRQWKTYRSRMLNQARDNALNRLVK